MVELGRLSNDKGYSLFLTVLIMVVFTIVSVSLISVVISGAKKSTKRESHTQAHELAEKGLKHLTSQINKDLNEKLLNDGRSQTEFRTDLVTVLKVYECKGNTVVVEGNGPTGSYEACVDNWRDSTNSPLQKEVIIKSIGNSTDDSKIIEAKLLMGAEEVPVPLKYALSSTKSHACEEDSNECLNGEGNMFLDIMKLKKINLEDNQDYKSNMIVQF